MGIRFSCHGCGKPLNIKHELAGKRGVCPECQVKFRIPTEDAETSIPLDEASVMTSPEPGSTAKNETESSDVGAQPVAVMQEASESTSATAPTAPETGDSAPGSTDGPELLADDSEGTWYVRPPSGGQYGPASAEVLQNWITEGRVARTALLWRDGWPQWREASEALSDIADQLPSPVQPESRDVFGGDDSRGRKTKSFAHEETSRLDYAVAENVTFAGDAKIGSTRKKRHTRSMTTMIFLAVLVIVLIIVLLVVYGRS